MRITGYDLPGIVRHPATIVSPVHSTGPVHVGIQRGQEVVDRVRGDAPEAVFTFEVEVKPAKDGGLDFRGPYVHGKAGDRFLYLSWGSLQTNGMLDMFRRAKLKFDTIDPADIQRAVDTGALLEGRLPMTDKWGCPVCATVRPPVLQWRVIEEPEIVDPPA